MIAPRAPEDRFECGLGHVCSAASDCEAVDAGSEENLIEPYDLPSGAESIRLGYDVDRECYRGTCCMTAEQMNETPNFLIQLGEALGPWGSLVVVLSLCGGAIWVVMSVRSNKVDHDRLEAKIDKGLDRLEGMVNKGRESVEGKIENLHKESRDEMQAWRKETRERTPKRPVTSYGRSTRASTGLSARSPQTSPADLTRVRRFAATALASA